MASAPQPDHLRKSFHPRGREVLTEHALEVSYFFDVLGDPFYEEALIDHCSKREFFGRLTAAAEACLIEGRRDRASGLWSGPPRGLFDGQTDGRRRI
jgi:hypothetical protein